MVVKINGKNVQHSGIDLENYGEEKKEAGQKRIVH